MSTRIQVRRDTTANWTTYQTTVPAQGEFCYDTQAHTLKIGDGTTSYANLKVISDGDTDISDYVSKTATASQNIESDLTFKSGKATIYDDGSADFSDYNHLLNLDGSYDSSHLTDPADVTTYLGGAGFFNTAGNNEAIYVYDDATSSDTVLISHDGSASLAGSDCEIDATGQVTIKKSAPYTDPSFRILDRNNSNANGVLLYGNGSATFAGYVTSQGYNSEPTDSGYSGLTIRNPDTGTVATDLKANGSATFAGGNINVQVYDVSGTDTARIVVKDVAESAGTELYLGRTANDQHLTAYTNNVEVFHVDYNGSASFASEVVTGGLSGAGGVGPNGYVFTGYVDANQGGALTSSIDRNGSASFADSVNLMPGSGVTRINLTASTGEIFCATGKTDSTTMIRVQGGRGSATQADVVNLNADGSASFGQASNSTNNNGVLIGGNNGQLNLYTTRYSADCFQILNTSGSGANVAVKFDGDGSATFASNVESGFVGGTSVGVQLVSTGFLNIREDSSAGDCFAIYKGSPVSSNKKIGFDSNGSASFNGRVYTSGITTDDNITATRTSGTYACYVGQLNGSDTSFINANGSATFSGTVTATNVPASDARFKENITPAKPQLADVVALGGLLKNYDWNDEAPLNEEIRAVRQLGLIAQEVEEVCPTITKTIFRTKRGKELTPEKVIPAVYEEEVIPAVYEEQIIPAEYKTILVPAEVDDEGNKISPAKTEKVLVTPEQTEQVLVTPEQTKQVLVKEEEVIPATYEVLDDNYKGISTDALIMKLIGAVAELSAKVAALEAA